MNQDNLNNNNNINIREEEAHSTNLTTNDENNECLNEVIVVHFENFTPEQRDLFNLLNTWGLPDLYDYLDDNDIYVSELKTLTSDFVGQLLKPFKWNKILKFGNALKEWQSSVRSDTPTTISSTLSNLTCEFTSSASTSTGSASTISTVSSPSTSSEVTDYNNIFEILNECHEGKLLLREINQITHEKVCLSGLRRDTLCNIIVDYHIRKGLKMSTRVCKQLADAIAILWPNEDKEFYYLARKNASPLGKLHFKYQNQLARLKKIGLCGSSAKSNKGTVEQNLLVNLEPQLDGEEHYQSLRNDVLSLEELILHWKGCSSKRFAFIAENNTKEIVNKWPQYKESTGYKLISIDYFTKHNDAGRMLDDAYIEDFYAKIVVLMKAQIKDPQSKIMLDNLMEDSGITLNGKYATIFILLHAILKNNPFKEAINEDGLKRKIRCSIKECQNSFIYCCTTAEGLEEYFYKLLNGKETIQPFIAVIGKSVSYPEHIILYIDGIKYKFSSILKAMDICFKSFQIFNLKYPASSHVVWQFVQIYFYSIEVKNDYIHSSAKNLKGQLDSV